MTGEGTDTVLYKLADEVKKNRAYQKQLEAEDHVEYAEYEPDEDDDHLDEQAG